MNMKSWTGGCEGKRDVEMLRFQVDGVVTFTEHHES